MIEEVWAAAGTAGILITIIVALKWRCENGARRTGQRSNQ